ncbi:MAG TPA: AMP-binding protein [Xanthobacteraceae bacterium]|nr:AMP-binding protein [Xanthobacteraceae bacterium]
MFALTHIVDRAAAYHARRTAVEQGAIQLSYGEVTQRAARLAGAMLARGIKPGDRVAILSRNNFRYFEVNLACAYAGIILIPLNHRLAARETDGILARTETRLLFQALPYDPRGIASIVWADDDPPGAPNAYEAMIAGVAGLARPHPAKLDDIVQIFFTSGTTGEPKGACLTHRNLTATAFDTVVSLELTGEDVWLHAPPMFHLVDATAIWGVTLVGGKHVTGHFDPVTFGATVRAHRVTQTALPPTLLDMVLRRGIDRDDYHSLNRLSFGGAPMPEPLFRKLSSAFGCPLTQSYGATEVSGGVCQQLPRDLMRNDGRFTNSVGQPLPHISVRLIDDGGNPLPAGEIGEIVVSGPRVMAGYWRNETATQAAIPDGWYRTGDLGRCDDEGHYAVVGRKKDMIITGGENVYPMEVENALLEHPAVAEAAVFGIPSARWGEEVCAVVFIDAGAAASGDELIAHCRKLIGGYKVPKAIEIAAEPLPKSGPGKIAKTLVRASYLEKGSI